MHRSLKLANLAEMYKTHLEQLGVKIDGVCSYLKTDVKLLSVIPNLRATSQGEKVDSFI